MGNIFYCLFCFFFNDTATTEIYTLSLHDALPIWILGIYSEWMAKRPNLSVNLKPGHKMAIDILTGSSGIIAGLVTWISLSGCEYKKISEIGRAHV